MSENRKYENRLLRHMTDEALSEIESHLEPVSFPIFTTIREPGDPIDYVYFPESGIISLVAPQIDGNTPELGGVGREGAVGCVAAVGSRKTYSRWLAQVPGKAHRCPASRVEDAFDRNAAFRQIIVCYMEAFLTHTMQSVACNALHPVTERLARWLLIMHDRGDTDRIRLTQEFLAEMLSVHRSSIVEANAALQHAGHIRSSRGAITITDREGLENASCDCYRLVRNRFENLLPGTYL